MSAVKDHAAKEKHKRSMILLSKSRSSDVVQYAPIAKTLSTLDPDTASKLRHKFEIAYMLCEEGLAFTKREAICELEEKHGVDLGTGCKNNQACATFVEYIAQSQREKLADVLGKAKFFSIQTLILLMGRMSCSLSYPLMHTPKMGTPQMGTPKMGTPKMGTPKMGTPQMGQCMYKIGPWQCGDLSTLTDRDSTSALLEPLPMHVSLVGRVS